MTDDRFDHELREFLAGRAASGPSPALVTRLQAVVLDDPQPAQRLVPRLGRGLFGLVAAVAAVLVWAVFAAQVGVTVPGQGGAGASMAPGVSPMVPHVLAPAGFFSPDAVADAERFLAAVADETAVEATLIVQAEPVGAQISTPDGWPERFDRDGNDERDIVTVVGIAPDGSIVCCLTEIGATAARAAADGYWNPQRQPTNLESDFEGATAEERDVALARFVQGITDLAPHVAAEEGVGRSSVASVVRLTLVLLPLLALVVVALRRRPAVVAGAGTAAAPGTLESVATTGGPDVFEMGDEAAPVAWPPETVDPGRDDRRWLWAALALLVGFVALTLVPALVAPVVGPRLDPSVDGQGMATIGIPYLPLACVGLAAAALAIYASRGQRRRRFGTVLGVLMVGVVGVSIVADARPDIGRVDRPWASWPDTLTVEHAAGGFSDQLIAPIEPGEPFALAMVVHNTSPVPMTILGLADIGTNLDFPPVARFVSLGWIDQSTTDGSIRFLSARPEDASTNWPITIPPGGRLGVVALGRGDECAEPRGTGSTLPLLRVPIAYRVLGVDRVAEVGLPALVVVAAASVCTVEIPGGTITYGP